MSCTVSDTQEMKADLRIPRSEIGTYPAHGLEKSVALLWAGSTVWSLLICWTAYWGGHIPGSPITFTDPNFWRGTAFLLLVGPLLALASALLSVGIVTVVAIGLAIFTDVGGGKLPERACEPVYSGNFKRL